MPLASVQYRANKALRLLVMKEQNLRTHSHQIEGPRVDRLLQETLLEQLVITKMKAILTYNENDSFCFPKTCPARKHAMDDGAGEVAVENGSNEHDMENESQC